MRVQQTSNYPFAIRPAIQTQPSWRTRIQMLYQVSESVLKVSSACGVRETRNKSSAIKPHMFGSNFHAFLKAGWLICINLVKRELPAGLRTSQRTDDSAALTSWLSDFISCPFYLRPPVVSQDGVLAENSLAEQCVEILERLLRSARRYTYSAAAHHVFGCTLPLPPQVLPASPRRSFQRRAFSLIPCPTRPESEPPVLCGVFSSMLADSDRGSNSSARFLCHPIWIDPPSQHYSHGS